MSGGSVRGVGLRSQGASERIIEVFVKIQMKNIWGGGGGGGGGVSFCENSNKNWGDRGVGSGGGGGVVFGGGSGWM